MEGPAVESASATERLARFVHGLDGGALDPAAREHATLCVLALDAAWETTDRAPVDVEVTLTSGARHAGHVDYPRGAPQNPASRAELEAKFDAVASPALPPAARARVIETVRRLDALPRIADLTAALVAPAGT